MSTTTSEDPAIRELRCSGCDEGIDDCEACEHEQCGSAICYGCLGEALGEIRPHPHEHGG